MNSNKTNKVDSSHSMNGFCPGKKFRVTDEGVFFLSDRQDRNGRLKPPMWICAPLLVERLRANGETQGHILNGKDPDGVCHQLTVPLSWLRGSALRLRRKLADGGLEMAATPPALTQFLAYVKEYPEKNVTGIRWFSH